MGALRFFDAADRQGVELIWDLLHFGWPSDIDVFGSSFTMRFGDFAAAFAKLLRSRQNETTFIAPINEISFLSWAGGDKGFLNPFALDRGAELKRQLVRAAYQASEANRKLLPLALFSTETSTLRGRQIPGHPCAVEW